jgi:ankyrin repeat protein
LGGVKSIELIEGVDLAHPKNDVHAAAYAGKLAACYGRYASTLNLLLDAGASIDTSDVDGWTPLTLAVCYCALKCLRVLLARGAAVLELDTQPCTSRHQQIAPASCSSSSKLVLTPLSATVTAGRPSISLESMDSSPVSPS